LKNKNNTAEGIASNSWSCFRKKWKYRWKGNKIF